MPENVNQLNQRTSVNDETLAAETYARLLPEYEALTPAELVPINLDIPSVVTSTLGALPEIRALRAQVVDELPRFDLVAFDKLEDYALALGYAHMQYLMATQPADDLDVVTDEATELRETLLFDANALARRGIIDGNKLKELRGPNGYKNTAIDLGVIASVLKESWDKIQGRSNVQAAELERAMKLSQRILRVVGLREQGPATVAAATDMRLRAFTLLTRTYDDARRAATYLRWSKSEFDRIAPSLYAGRSNGRKKPEGPEVPATTPGTGAPTIPAAIPATTPASPAHPAGNAPTTTATEPFMG